MRERRGSPRSGLVYYLEVRDADSDALLGHLADLTPDGLRLVGTSLSLQPDHGYRLRIAAPEGTTGTVVTCTAVCRWTGPDVNPDLQAAGLVFTDITEEQRLAIRDLIRSLGLAT